MNAAARIVEIALWLGLFAITCRPTYRLLFSKALTLDAVWAGIWFGTLNRVTFNLANLYAPDSMALRQVLHVHATVVAAVMVSAVWKARRHEPR